MVCGASALTEYLREDSSRFRIAMMRTILGRPWLNLGLAWASVLHCYWWKALSLFKCYPNVTKIHKNVWCRTSGSITDLHWSWVRLWHEQAYKCPSLLEITKKIDPVTKHSEMEVMMVPKVIYWVYWKVFVWCFSYWRRSNVN